MVGLQMDGTTMTFALWFIGTIKITFCTINSLGAMLSCHLMFCVKWESQSKTSWDSLADVQLSSAVPRPARLSGPSSERRPDLHFSSFHGRSIVTVFVMLSLIFLVSPVLRIPPVCSVHNIILPLNTSLLFFHSLRKTVRVFLGAGELWNRTNCCCFTSGPVTEREK